MPKIETSLNFMPAFFCKHAGVTYGEAFYFDPEYRAEIERKEGLFLYDVLGRHGIGSPDPQPAANIFIQPVDLVMKTQGAEWRFPSDGTVESWGTPWAGLDSSEIERIDLEEAANSPVVDAIIRQYREMEHIYGNRADIFGTKTGLMNIHTPYTTAHQLLGEDLFIMMLAEPESAEVVFQKIWDIYVAIFKRIAGTTGAKLNRIQLGDCSASLLSEATYRSGVMPFNIKILSQFEGGGYHSCGSSSHLIEAFSHMQNIDVIQLGPGTDIQTSAKFMPSVHMQPLIDPVRMMQYDTEHVKSYLREVIGSVKNAPAATLCIWALDRDTPIENVAAAFTVIGH